MRLILTSFTLISLYCLEVVTNDVLLPIVLFINFPQNGIGNYKVNIRPDWRTSKTRVNTCYHFRKLFFGAISREHCSLILLQPPAVSSYSWNLVVFSSFTDGYRWLMFESHELHWTQSSPPSLPFLSLSLSFDIKLPEWSREGRKQ